MKRSLMLMCAYGNTNATYNLRNNCTFADLDDVDMENLVRLARTFSLEHVCVVIEQCGEAISVGAESEQCYMQDTTLYNLVVNGELRVDDDVDLLPEFYLHRDKVPMTKLWAQGYIKNDSVWVTAVCSMLEDKGCRWSVHARLLEANQIFFFYLRKWNNVHSYGVSIWTSNNPRVGSDMISDIVASHVWAKPLTRPTDVVLDLKDNYGLDALKRHRGNYMAPIPYHLINYVRTAKPSRNITPEVMLILITMNTTTVFVDSSYNSKHVLTAFNIVDRPLLILDGTFLKGRFKGFLLAATTKNVNQDMMTNLTNTLTVTENI
ncbi:hypothetical protein ACSBR1_026945 [Camellia fascicularis]